METVITEEQQQQINEDLHNIERDFHAEGILETRIFTMKVFGDGGSGDYIDPDFGFTIHSHDVSHFVREKALTDSELASEYWCEYAEVQYWDPKKGRLHPEQGRLHRTAKERVAVITQFALNPHFDDLDDLDEE